MVKQLHGLLAETPDGDIYDFGDHPDYPIDCAVAESNAPVTPGEVQESRPASAVEHCPCGRPADRDGWCDECFPYVAEESR
jgi:hypothetical protein